MEEVYAIVVASKVDTEDLPCIGKADRLYILTAIRRKLSLSPDLFGKPLRNPLAGFWDLRVGDYRVIYKIRRHTVVILLVMHRSRGYEKHLKKALNQREN